MECLPRLKGITYNYLNNKILFKLNKLVNIILSNGKQFRKFKLSNRMSKYKLKAVVAKSSDYILDFLIVVVTNC